MDPATRLAHDQQYKSIYDFSVNLKISFTAAACVGIYDYLCTFNQERTLIWPRRNSMVKVIWLINRYYFLFAFLTLCGVGTFAEMSTSMCAWSFRLHPSSCILGQLAPQMLLAIRVLAVYNWNRVLMALFSTLILLAQVAPFVIMSQVVGYPSVDGISGCLAGVRDPTAYDFTWTFWMPSMAVEITAFLLIFTKYLRTRNASFTPGGDLLGRLAADSLIYFLPIAALSTANAMFYALATEVKHKPLFMYPMVAASVVLSCRLVLNLHADMLTGDLTSSNGSSLQARLLSFIKGSHNGKSTVGTRTAQDDFTPNSSTKSHRSTPSLGVASHVVILTKVERNISDKSDAVELVRPPARFSEEP